MEQYSLKFYCSSLKIAKHAVPIVLAPHHRVRSQESFLIDPGALVLRFQVRALGMTTISVFIGAAML